MRARRLAAWWVPMVCVFLALPVRAAVLKVATILPDGTTWMKEVRAAAQEIEKRTEGRVKFQFYPGGTMGNYGDVLRKIRLGQLHGGGFTAGGLSPAYTDIQIYTMPFIFQSYAEVDYVRARMDAELLGKLEEAGFVGFGLVESGFGYMFSNKPIRSSGDLKGQKVWVPEGDKVGRAGLEATGVSPIPLPLTDVLTGLQTGLVDTVANTPEGCIALQWHTKVKYMTDVPLLYTYGTLVVAKKAFDQLSSGDQAIVREVMGRSMQTLNRASRESNAKARETLKAQGIQIVSASPEETKKWLKIADEAIAKLAGQGEYTDQGLARLRALLAEYRSAPPAKAAP